MLAYISVCLFVFATAQPEQPGFSGNGCPEVDQCLNIAQEKESTCDGCIQQDSRTGELLWNSNDRNCATIERKNRNLKRFLNCENAYLTQQRQLYIRGCESENNLDKCRGNQFGFQENCADMFRIESETTPPSGLDGFTNPISTVPKQWNQWSPSGDVGSWMQVTPPVGNSNRWGIAKRSVRNKRQTDMGMPFPGPMGVWSDTCQHVTNSSFSKCDKIQCNIDGCDKKYDREQRELTNQYKGLETQFEACVKEFDRTYDRSYMYNDSGYNNSPGPIGRRRRR